MNLADLFSRRTIRRRKVSCALYGIDVDVEYEARGFPGFRQPTAVKSCTAFHPPEAVACRVRCLDTNFWRQRPPARPIISVDELRGDAVADSPAPASPPPREEQR